MKDPVSINIALAGDHSLNLYALASLLKQQSHFCVVSINKDVSQLSSSISLGGQEYYPRVVLLDINFDLYRAVSFVSFIKGSHPKIRLAALGLTKDRHAILRLQQLGVDSYIPKNSHPDQLENILTRLAREDHSSIPLLEQAFGGSSSGAADEPNPGTMGAWPSVTTTERRFFRLAVSEASNEDIRRKMKLCESTFQRLAAKVYGYFGVRSRNGLVLALYRNRLLIRDDI